MIEYAAALGASFLSSAHCIGMCGGLAVTIGGTAPRLSSNLARQGIYSLGRIFTYSFLGVVGGFAGRALAEYQWPLIGAQRFFSILAGVVMLLVGVSALGIIPKGLARRAGPVTDLAAPLCKQFFQLPGRVGVFLAGIATGFLPCGLVYAFLALAVASGSAAGGGLLMACFGLGTVPAMAFIGCGGGALSHANRARVFRVAACCMIVMGGVAIYRGLPRAEANPCCDHDVTANAEHGSAGTL